MNLRLSSRSRIFGPKFIKFSLRELETELESSISLVLIETTECPLFSTFQAISSSVGGRIGRRRIQTLIGSFTKVCGVISLPDVTDRAGDIIPYLFAAADIRPLGLLIFCMFDRDLDRLNCFGDYSC